MDIHGHTCGPHLDKPLHRQKTALVENKTSIEKSVNFRFLNFFKYILASSIGFPSSIELIEKGILSKNMNFSLLEYQHDAISQVALAKT